MRLLLLLAFVALGVGGVPVSRSTLRTARDFDAADADMLNQLDPRDIIRAWSSLSQRDQPAARDAAASASSSPADIYYALPGDYESHDGYLYPAGTTDAADYEYYMPTTSEAAGAAMPLSDWEVELMGAQLEQEAMQADLDADAEEAAVRWGAMFTPNAYDADTDYDYDGTEVDADTYNGVHQPRPRVSFKPQRLLSGTMSHSRVVPSSALESGKSVSLTFPKWDPALGRLDAVSFILDAQMNGEAAYSNPKRQESAVSLNAGAQLSVRSPQLVASLLHQRQAQAAAAITTPATLPITRAAPTSVGARSTGMGTEFRDRSGRFEAIRAAEDGAARRATQQAIVSGEVEALQKPLVIAMPVQQVQRRTKPRSQARFPPLEARDIQSTILSRGGANAELKRAMLNEFTGRDFVTLILDKETIGAATAPESSASGLSVQLAIGVGANVTVVYHFTDDREPRSAAPRYTGAAADATTAGASWSPSMMARIISESSAERDRNERMRRLVREMQHDPQMLLNLFPGLMSPAANPPLGSDLARSMATRMPRTTTTYMPIEAQAIRREYQYQYPMPQQQQQQQQPMMMRASSARSFSMMDIPDMDMPTREQPMMNGASGRGRATRQQPQPQQHISDQELERLFAEHLMSGDSDSRDMAATADYETEYDPTDYWAFASTLAGTHKEQQAAAKDAAKPKEKQDKEKDKKDKEEEEKDEREEAERVADAVMARVRAAAASAAERVRSAFPASMTAQAERVARSALDPATWQQQMPRAPRV